MNDDNLRRLEATTNALRARCDKLQSEVGHLPLPPPALKAPLTDEQRVAFCRELRSFMLNGKMISLDEAIWAYESEAKARMR